MPNGVTVDLNKKAAAMAMPFVTAGNAALELSISRRQRNVPLAELMIGETETTSASTTASMGAPARNRTESPTCTRP